MAKWGTMSDTFQGEGRWLAADGKWYPTEPAQPSLATSTDASFPLILVESLAGGTP